MLYRSWLACALAVLFYGALAAPSPAQQEVVPYRLPDVAPPPVAPEVVPALPAEPDAPQSGFWVLPNGWLPPVNWEGGLEVGINGTEGNAEALSSRVGANLKRKTDLHEIGFKLTYAKALADGVETQHNALFDAGYERFLGDTPWTFFGKTSLEYDEFKAFDLRLALNGGLGYQLIKTETTRWKVRAGAGVSHEIGGPDDSWVPEAVLGTDFQRQLTKRQKIALTVDYFPQWDDFTNYRLVSDASWEVLLDEAHNLSLKLSVNDRYDSTPNGRKPNDVIYALLLLWQL